MEVILQYVILPVIGILSNVVTWQLARKKNKIDIENQELELTRSNIKLYQDMIDDLKKRYDSDLDGMRAKMELMQRDLEECRKRHKI